MKKMSVVMIALSLSVSLAGIATAGMGGGCDNCGRQGAVSDPYRKFQADTIDLRQEMMTKRFEVQRENMQAIPDAAKVSALQAEIKVIQAKIMEIRSRSGLPAGKNDGECPKAMGDCGTRGMGGCNNGPCAGPK
jgi:hypothetical protein